MSSENENFREIQRKLEGIEKRVKSIESGSISDLEHQLFFGVIFSLLILFLTVDPNQIAEFFQMVNFPPEAAIETATRIKTWGAILTFSSAIVRYYSALVKDEIRKSQKLRLASIVFVVMSFELFLFFPIMNITFPLPEALGWMSLSLKIVILLVIYRSIALFLEKKLLSLYASKKLILKKDIEPFVSKTLSLAMLVSYVALVVALTIFFLIRLYVVEVFLALFVIGFLIFVVPYTNRIRKYLR